LLAVRSVFSDEKKLSIAALSQTLPDRLMLQTMPLSAINCWNCSLAGAAVMVNDHTAFGTDWMPFAGHRRSGYGIGGIPWTMDEMSQEKMIVFRM
jgi:acyl-CoA reductase-like NAD-dependent aldehyde dehydrogenase